MPSTTRAPRAPGAAAAAAPVTPVATSWPRWFPLLLLLFAGSGCAALIYEIVWYQLLQLAVGSTAVSLGVLLATFMGGLCIGSLALPRLAAARRHPLRVYAWIELGTAGCALLVLWLMPALDYVYVAGAQHGLPNMLLRGLLAAICLLPPTILMGASLPAIVRWVESSREGASLWGWLYGANIAGAVLGCLWAGYGLLRYYNLAVATWAGVAINVTVALISLGLAMASPQAAEAGRTASPEAADRAAATQANWPVLGTIALSGFTALGAEVVWTRLLGLLLGATVYTFSIILAVFLAGLGLGSGLGAWIGRQIRARLALGWAQMALAAATAWTAWVIAAWLPNWPINPELAIAPHYTFELDLMRCTWAILPAAVLWGASFPLALAAAARGRGEDPGRVVGGVYAANTAGGIVGALSFSLMLIPWLGTHACQRLLVATAALSSLLLLLGPGAPGRLLRRAGVVATALLMALAAWSVPNVPGELIAYGRRIALDHGLSEVLYVGEGRNSSIAVTRWNDGAIQFHVSGKVEASTELFDMRLQRSLGHMPALVHNGDPASVLVVGFGAGVTAGSFVTYPGLRRLVICEMEPLVPPTSTRFFGPENYEVLHDARTQIVYDDARHFVLTTPEKFDVITSDPIHPWVKGSATLYSREYFQMEKDHLKPGGVVTQWVPLYESDAATVRSELATFFSVFPNGTVWANDTGGQGYDVFLLGTEEPLDVDVDALQRRLDSPADANVLRSLQDVGFNGAVDLLATYAGREEDLRPWLQGAAINTDLDLRLQYLAGMALNDDQADAIYAAIAGYRRFPADLFHGSPATLQALAVAMQAHNPGQGQAAAAGGGSQP